MLLPDGFRFSPSKTRRDWTDEGTAKLRKYYAALYPEDGKLPIQPYLLATIRSRADLAAGKWVEVAAKQQLNPKYLQFLWEALTDTKPSQPLDTIRAQWRASTEKDIAALVAQVAGWQASLWKTVKVGNYISATWHGAPGSEYVESLSRQAAFDPPASTSVPLRVTVKPAPGQSEIRLYLAAHETGAARSIVWQRPRFEAPGKPPLLLCDYASFGPSFEVDYPSAFVGAAKYLSAAAGAAHDPQATTDELATRNQLDAAFLKQWAKVLAIEPRKQPAAARTRAVAALTLLDEPAPHDPERAALRGWKKKGTDLPTVVANSSDQTWQIPGRVSGRTIAAHPTPQEFVAVAWKSPLDGAVKITARVAHAHPACGNGVAWWLEHRHADHAAALGEGTLDLGKDARLATTVKLAKGDLLVLAVDPREGEHSCDMTELWLSVTEEEKPNRIWDLGQDVSSDVQGQSPR